jgi:hypothetical protein
MMVAPMITPSDETASATTSLYAPRTLRLVREPARSSSAPQPGLAQDVGGHRQQRDAVRGGGEDLDAVVTVGPARRGRAFGELHRDEREHQPGDVRQHVARVGEQGEAAREEAGRDLDAEEDPAQPEHRRQPPAAAVGGAAAMGAGMGVAVSGAVISPVMALRVCVAHPIRA